MGQWPPVHGSWWESSLVPRRLSGYVYKAERMPSKTSHAHMRNYCTFVHYNFMRIGNVALSPDTARSTTLGRAPTDAIPNVHFQSRIDTNIQQLTRWHFTTVSDSLGRRLVRKHWVIEQCLGCMGMASICMCNCPNVNHVQVPMTNSQGKSSFAWKNPFLYETIYIVQVKM